MRVAELADLTGVTVRTVRHYHSLGLLPLPPVRGGARDYDLVHVARLSRIRWLAEAGVPLATVAEVLDAERAHPEDSGVRSSDAGGHSTGSTEGTGRADVLRDLRAAMAGLDAQLERLSAQRNRLSELLDAVEGGAPLTVMPRVAADFYARLEHHAPEDRVRSQIRRERDFVELAYYRGVIPAELELLFVGLDDEALEEAVAGFARDPDQELTDAEVDDLAAQVVDRMTVRLGEALPLVARTLGVAGVRRAYQLYVGSASGLEKRLGTAVGRRLEALVEGTPP